MIYNLTHPLPDFGTCQKRTVQQDGSVWAGNVKFLHRNFDMDRKSFERDTTPAGSVWEVKLHFEDDEQDMILHTALRDFTQSRISNWWSSRTVVWGRGLGIVSRNTISHRAGSEGETTVVWDRSTSTLKMRRI